MVLTGKQRRYLRGLAHNKQPVLAIGHNNLSEAVLTELEIVLNDHELIKIKLPGIDAKARKVLIEQLCAESGAGFVQLIGRIAVVYRQGEKNRVKLPD
ncbi:MAG: ribosome assembly RNA-binding protein YhbY [Gammaproteobacteria bacterium]|nr:MAG: ribosome assembly RNA-binding protein YhbY [Gammaproteobacteria bacterium]